MKSLGERKKGIGSHWGMIVRGVFLQWDGGVEIGVRY